MVTKEIGSNQPITYRAVNTDFAESTPGNSVAILQSPEDSGDRVWVLDAVQYSYKGGTTIAGGVTVKLDEKIKFDMDISTPEGVLSLYIPSQVDKTLAVILKAGGSGIVGKLNVQWHLEPAQ